MQLTFIKYGNKEGKRIYLGIQKSTENGQEKKLIKVFYLPRRRNHLYTQDILEKLEKQEVLTMVDSSYILVEFMPWTPC